MDTPSPPPLPPREHPASAPVCRFKPWLFFGFLLAPTVLFLLTAWTTQLTDYGMNAVKVLTVGSVIAGFVCGIHFARSQKNLSVGARWGIGIVSVLGCAGVAFALGWGGCLLLVTVGN